MSVSPSAMQLIRLCALGSNRGHRSGGFTLIEVLVTVVVLSLGLLGLAGLQVVSLTNNQTAYYRSIATQQANDMMDRMRANLNGISAGNYDNQTAANQGCLSSSCTAENMAKTDLFQWLANNAALLPSGSGAVRCCITGTIAAGNCACNTANSNRIFEVSVQWTERAATAGGNNATQSFVTRFAP